MHILLHPYKSGCQRKTFLCAVAAQMFHKVVPTTSEVRAQPICPHQAPPSPSLCGLETGRTRQVFGKQALFLRTGARSLPWLCSASQQARPRGWGKPAPAPWLLLWSPRAEGLSLPRPLLSAEGGTTRTTPRTEPGGTAAPFLGSSRPVLLVTDLRSRRSWPGGQDLACCQVRRQWSDSLSRKVRFA